MISLVGYENLTYFYKIFKEKYGYTPKNYKSIER
ncbi:MAG: AraC family transcriptional regulator [Clostridium celatum]|nr:AraC family transcriptional regulator [Clostridium celatum]